MKWIFLPIVVVLFTAFATNVFAEESFSTASAFGVKEVKSLELLLNTTPTYVAGTNLTFQYALLPENYPDGIYKFIDVKFRIVVDRSSAQASITHLYIDEKECANSPYVVSLPLGQYVNYFKCINAFNDTTFGIVHNITFNSNRARDNVVFLFMPTYINNPDFSSINNMESNIDLIFAKVYEGDILSNHDFCINSNTSRKQLEIFTGNSTLNTTTTKYIDTYCEMGCDNQTGYCQSKGFESGLFALIIIFVLLGIGFLLVRSKGF